MRVAVGIVVQICLDDRGLDGEDAELELEPAVRHRTWRAHDLDTNIIDITTRESPIYEERNVEY